MSRLPRANACWPALLLAACALCAGSPALAESGRYRIEVLVFMHLDSLAEPREMDELRAFSAFPELGEWQAPEAPVRLEVMSSLMQDNWRRLRLSGNYRPLLFATWEQSRIDYHPPVRLHDEEVIAEHLHFPHRVAFVDLRSADLFAAYRAPYYRLDGTVQLVRSRFLHLNLDLEYRQDLLPRPLADPGGAAGPAPGEPLPLLPGEPSAAEEEPRFIQVELDPAPGPALVHALSQSRQVRTDELQYFDTPFLGVLARITATSGE